MVVTPPTASIGIQSGRSRVLIGLGPTLEDRVATIEARLAVAEQELSQQLTQLAEHKADVDRKAAAAEERQRAEIALVHELVKALSADPVPRRLWGVAFLVTGILLNIAALWLT